MQALQKKQAAEQQMRDILAGTSGDIVNKGLDERIEHCKHLQYVEHQQIFAVMYSNVHKAACDNSVSGIKYFLSSRVKPKVHVDDYDSQGNCAIHMAAERGCNDAVKCLVENSCDVDVRTTYGNTAMMYACKENQLSTIRVLVELGSKLNHKNKSGQTAIHYAAQCDHVEVLELLLELLGEHTGLSGRGDGDDDDDAAGEAEEREDAGLSEKPTTTTTTPSGKIVINDDDSIAGESVATNSSSPSLHRLLNTQSNNGMTPLHLACLYNSTRAVDFLIANGAKINALDSAGDTCLHKAAKKGAHALFRRLLAAGANDNIRNQFGEKASNVLRDDIYY